MEIFINYNVVYVEIVLKLLILNMKWMKSTLNVRIYQLVLISKAKNPGLAQLTKLNFSLNGTNVFQNPF